MRLKRVNMMESNGADINICKREVTGKLLCTNDMEREWKFGLLGTWKRSLAEEAGITRLDWEGPPDPKGWSERKKEEDSIV